MAFIKKAVSMWTCDDVSNWLLQEGFSDYMYVFCEIHKVDGPALLCITEEDLKNPSLKIWRLGDMKRLLISISKLRSENPSCVDSLFPYQATSVDPCSPGRSSRVNARGSQQYTLSNGNIHRYEFQDGDDKNINDHENTKLVFKAEIGKLVISYLYVSCVFLVTAFVMVEVHDRVPDMEKYPPLPDIVLDNVPYMSWAFKASEICGLLLTSFLCIIIFFHKHRFIVLRRVFAITGTVFLLRCITMLATALSVPDTRLGCAGKMYGDFNKKVWRAIEICSGFGMTITGVRTCGDYMFSGHTIVLTVANHFITEYSPHHWYTLHTISWLLNIFGTFFILAAHEHYSIDVIIAFYITSRLFLYYHSLANSCAHKQKDRRIVVWFPMFTYFEAKVDGAVPNEYNWPVPQWLVSYFKQSDGHIKSS